MYITRGNGQKEEEGRAGHESTEVEKNNDLQQPRHSFLKKTFTGGEEEASENPDYLSYPRLHILSYPPK
jgi:hypothetical protein